MFSFAKKIPRLVERHRTYKLLGMGCSALVVFNATNQKSACELVLTDVPTTGIVRTRGFMKKRPVSSLVTDTRIENNNQIVALQKYAADCWKVVVESLEMLLRMCFWGYTFAPVAVAALPVLCYPSIELQSMWWSYFRYSAQQTGPCLVKLLQWLATRPDICGDYIAANIQDLQSSRRSIDVKDVESILTQEFGPNWGKDITLSKLPDRSKAPQGLDERLNILGCGCVAQVVKGTMADGSLIAIKVMNSGTKESIAKDISIIRLLFSAVECIPGLQSLSLKESLEEFSTSITSQLDLSVEANNLLRFRQNFRVEADENAGRYSTVTFPKPQPGYASANVLVETFMEGILISDMCDCDSITKKKLARFCIQTMLKMVFNDNFVHADLHPGNIIVRNVDKEGQEKSWCIGSSPGDAWQLGLIDAGMVAELSKTDRQNFVDLFLAIAQNDGDRVGRLMVERSTVGTCLDTDAFAKTLGQVVSEVHEMGFRSKNISVGGLLARVLSACYTYQVKLEPKFMSVVLAIGVMEGLAKQLDPDLDLLAAAAPYIAAAAAKILYEKIELPSRKSLTHR